MDGLVHSCSIGAALDFLEGLSFSHMGMAEDEPEILCIRGYRTYWHDDMLTTEFHIDVHVTSGLVRSEEHFVEYGRFDELADVRSSVPSGTVTGILETCGWFPGLTEAPRYTFVNDSVLRYMGDALFDSFEYLA